MGEDIAKIIVAVILNNPYTLFFSPAYRFHLIQEDPDDNKFVDCAVIANAKFVVTDDLHFRVLKTYNFPKISVVGIDAFLSIVKGGKEK